MKILVAYSTLTGNTQKVAEAMAAALGEQAELKTAAEALALTAAYEKIIVGFWVDKSTADKAAAELLAGLHGKKVALFCTMGAYPRPPYRDLCLENAAKLLPQDNELLAENFACQGAIDPKLIEMFKKLPPEHPHHVTPESLARYAEAAKHPDGADLEQAAAFARRAASSWEA